ncbi:MAG: radical SAM protein [Pseudomonadota bacterium]|nr:radical SAM protein [Pseudomonadota bacterium]
MNDGTAAPGPSVPPSAVAPDTRADGAELWRDTRRNVEINVGKICNNKCVFCLDGLPATEMRRYMPFPDMQAEIQRWYDAGNRSIGFLGGEPTTYPWILDAIRFARDLGYTRIALATNGTKFFRHDFVDKVLDAGLTRVTMSMHGHTPALEDALTRVPGNFEKKKSGLLYLLKKRDEGFLRDNVSVNVVVNAWNYKHLPAILKFFYELGMDDVRANFVRAEGYAETETSLIPTYTEVVPYVVKAILLNEYKYKRTFTLGGFPLCVLPLTLVSSRTMARRYVGEFRDLDTDCSIRTLSAEGFPEGIATVEGGRARFNWQERKRHDLKRHVKACERCAYTDVCEGTWKEYLGIHGEGELRPIPG